MSTNRSSGSPASSVMWRNRSDKSAAVPRASITTGAPYFEHKRVSSVGAYPVPSKILSNCTVMVPSLLAMPAETLVCVPSTSTATPNTTGRPSKSPGVPVPLP